jgi:hypothetical protein
VQPETVFNAVAAACRLAPEQSFFGPPLQVMAVHIWAQLVNGSPAIAAASSHHSLKSLV